MHSPCTYKRFRKSALHTNCFESIEHFKISSSEVYLHSRVLGFGGNVGVWVSGMSCGESVGAVLIIKLTSLIEKLASLNTLSVKAIVPSIRIMK